MVSFYAFPVIFIDSVTANCYDRKPFFSKKGTLIKRAVVRTSWTPLDLPLVRGGS